MLARMKTARRKLLRFLDRKDEALRRYFAKQIWLASLGLEEGSVHRSIELKGRRDFRKHLTLAPGCWIERDCTIWFCEDDESNPTVSLGNVYIGRNCYIGAVSPVTIQDNTLIGAYSYITSGNHKTASCETPIRTQGYVGEPTMIGRDVWVGCHVVVLAGVTIGDQAIVGAGAVITKSIPGREIWAGVPARKIGQR
jgi:acetyltransferase-like isoleucine patch superfamily enzyme